MNARVGRIKMRRTSDDDIVIRVCFRSDLRIDWDLRAYFLGSALRICDHVRREDREVVGRQEETWLRREEVYVGSGNRLGDRPCLGQFVAMMRCDPRGPHTGYVSPAI